MVESNVSTPATCDRPGAWPTLVRSADVKKRSNTFGRDFDWDQPRAARERVVYRDGHSIVNGNADDYQILGRRLVTPKPGPGYSIQPSCGYESCIDHVDLVPPIRPAYPAGVCVYCGFPATTRDHVLPKSWTGLAERTRVVTVPACVECNSSINDSFAPTIAERRRIAHASIRRRYSRYFSVVMVGASDLALMGYAMRSAAVARMNTHVAVMGRLAWPLDPLYDVRALGDLEGI